MEKITLIGINGGIACGKDTLAQLIQYLIVRKNTDNSDKVLSFEFQGLTHNNLSEISRRQPWVVRKFADKLKDIVCLLIGCTRLELEDQDFKNKELGEDWWYYKSDDIRGMITQKAFDNLTDNQKTHWKLIKLTPRLILQLLGTEGGRDVIHPNIWVNSLFSEYVASPKGTAHDLKDWSELYTHKECKNCKKQYSGWKRQYLCKECIEDDSIQFYPNWLITDMRFPNEMDAIKSRKGITIKINRPIDLRFPYLWKLYKETEQTNFDEDGFLLWLKDYDSEYYKVLTHPSEISLQNETFDYVIDNDGTLADLIGKVRQILIKERVID